MTRRWGSRANRYPLPSALRDPSMDTDFDTYDTEVMRRETSNWCYALRWLGTPDMEHPPGDIDPRLTVLIADLGVSSEIPFALDYRTSFGQPRVLLYTWHLAPTPYDVEQGEIGSRWIEVAGDFLTFWLQVGSGTA